MLRVKFDGNVKTERGLRRAIISFQAIVDPTVRSLSLIQKRAEQLAPKRSGRLAGSIKSSASMGVYSELPYANPIHWGWSKRGITENMFILNAARETEVGGWLNFFEDYVEDALDKVVGK